MGGCCRRNVAVVAEAVAAAKPYRGNRKVESDDFGLLAGDGPDWNPYSSASERYSDN